MYRNTFDDPEKDIMAMINLSNRGSTRRRQSSRDRRYNARRTCRVYTIEDAKAGTVESNNAVKFNCEENLHRTTCVQIQRGAQEQRASVLHNGGHTRIARRE